MIDDWQDIGTAPTGTVIRLKYPDGTEVVAPWPLGRPLNHHERKTLARMEDWPDYRKWTPTHWRPHTAPTPLGLDDILPCDVHLPPATVIRAGCSVRTLLLALGRRVGVNELNEMSDTMRLAAAEIERLRMTLREAVSNAGDPDTIIDLVNAALSGKGES